MTETDHDRCIEGMSPEMTEAQLRATFAAMSEGMALHEVIHAADGRALDYRILEVNPAFEQQTGIPRERIVGRLASEAYGTPEPPFLELYAEVARTGQPRQFEHYFEPLDRTFRVNVFSPGAGRFVTIFQDVSAYRRMQARLRETQERLQGILDAIPDLLFELGLDGRYHDYHTRRPELLAAPPEVFLGKRVTDVLPPEAAAICLDALREAHEQGISTGHRFAVEIEGRRRWFELSVARKHTDEVGEPRFIMISRDVTDRQRVEEALRRSETMLSLFMRYSPIDVYIKEVSPTTSRILRVSDNYHEMLGRPAAELTGKTMDELFPPELAARMTADDWAVVTTGEVLTVDKTFQGRHYTSIKFPIVLEGETLLAGYTLDITERKALESVLQRQATTDDLTGLANRRRFVAGQGRARARRATRPPFLDRTDRSRSPEGDQRYTGSRGRRSGLGDTRSGRAGCDARHRRARASR